MFKNKLAWALCAFFIFAPLIAVATDGPLKNGHPKTYTVQPGDTLWDISKRFLRDPWYWPEIWYENPDISNPHLIYPGDTIKLTVVDGKPRLTVERGGGTVKLSPKIRVEDLDQAITTIPMSALRPFLRGDRLVSAEEYEGAPYIVAGADERVMGSQGDPVYVRGLPDSAPGGWTILRKGDPFVDPDTGKVLGYEATHVGDAQLQRNGDPATFVIADSTREVLPGDRLFQSEDRVQPSRFMPRAPERSTQGSIIAVMDGVTQIGQYDVVAINRGSGDGLKPGHVLEVFKRGRTVKDRYSEEEEMVTLPDEKAGAMIIFRTYPEMSFALIMEATRAMTVGDIARSP